jgi:Mg-chelatase subunit ChlD
MTDPNYHALIVVMDRSGSMSAIQKEMETALQIIIDEQAKLPGMVTVDLIQFDSVIEPVFVMTDAEKVKIKLEPRGATALYDALGVAINGFTKSVTDLPEHARPSKITLIAVTDGEENSSQEYDLNTIRKLVATRKEDEGWEFLFLGSNQDAVLSGKSLGFEEDASLTFDSNAQGVQAMARSANRFVTDSRSGARQGFTEVERDSASRRKT